MSSAARAAFDDGQRLIVNDPGYLEYLNTTEQQWSNDMSLIARQPTTSNFEKAPPGLALAICYSIVDIGWQASTYKGEESLKEKVVISFELPNVLMEDGRPFMVNAFVTNSLAPKAVLRKYLEGWRGKTFTDEELRGFDLSSILGKPCMLNIVHTESNGKEYANIDSVSPIMKSMKDTVSPPVNKLIIYDMSKPDEEVFASLPEWLKKKIDESKPNPNSDNKYEPAGEEQFDDDIPF